MDEKRLASAQKLLDAAHEFWRACNEEGQRGAVQWLTGTNGELIIFTRSEYRNVLMSNIESLSNQDKVHFFSEQMPIDGDENE